MNLEFSETQEQLRDEVRKFLSLQCGPKVVRQALDAPASCDRPLWRELAGLGLLGIALPEKYGGAEAGYLELCVVAEEIGRALAPVPFASTVYLAAELIKAAGTEEQKCQYLPAIASGELIACLAFSEGPGNPAAASVQTMATQTRMLNGEKWPVLDGDVADLIVVVARDEVEGGLSLFLVDAADPNVVRTTLESLDPTRGQARLAFHGAVGQMLGSVGQGWRLLEAAFDRAAVLIAFEQIGGAERALETARQYALDRMAFGRQIGSFQAIKHKLVDMWIAVVLARSNAYYAAWALSSGPDALPRAAATARVSATQAFQLCAKENIQIHGGMGFTWDYDCHIHYRRSQLLALAIGGLMFWQDRLVQHLRDEVTI